VLPTLIIEGEEDMDEGSGERKEKVEEDISKSVATYLEQGY